VASPRNKDARDGIKGRGEFNVKGDEEENLAKRKNERERERENIYITQDYMSRIETGRYLERFVFQTRRMWEERERGR